MMLRRDCELIDDFVRSFATLDDLYRFHDEPPPTLLFDGVDADDWNLVRWKPRKLADPRDGIEALRRVGRLPTLFEQLARSYAWLDVDLGVCRLFGNPPTRDFGPLADSMFADPVLNNTLLPAQLVRFALAPDCCYDPICFDLSRFDGNDCPVMRLAHESILMHDRLGDRETLFESFRDLVDAVIAASQKTPQPRDRTNG